MSSRDPIVWSVVTPLVMAHIHLDWTLLSANTDRLYRIFCCEVLTDNYWFAQINNGVVEATFR